MTPQIWLFAGMACLWGILINAAMLAPTQLGPAQAEVAAASASKPAAPQHLYRPEPGPYDVAERDLALPDPARGKELGVRVYLPTPRPNVRLRGGPLPLVVFSHGAGGDRRVGGELLAHWASHGYVVVAPTHADSLLLQREAGSKPDIDRTLGTFILPATRANRVRDCSLVLDSLALIEREIPALAGQVDLERVALAGHSAGALTAMLGTGAADNGNPGLADARFDCALVLSGHGIGRGGLLFDAGSWAAWQVPALVATGSLDSSSRTGQRPESRRDPYNYAPSSGNKYLLFIEGATHMSFTGDATARLAGKGRGALVGEYLEPGGNIGKTAQQYDQAAIFEVVQSATLAFLDTYLKADTTAAAYISGDALEQALAGVEWHSK